MEPASFIGITASTASLLKILLQASLDLQSALRGIKAIDEATEELAGEVEAFRSILLGFETELRTSDFVPHVHRWWDLSRLEELLSNTVKTFSRLDTIIKDVGKQRSILPSLRQYWRSKSYDKEIGHIRLRMGTYITALQIPIELGKINTIRQSLDSRAPMATQAISTQRDMDTHIDMDVYAAKILGNRVLELEESIRTLSSGIQSLLDRQDSTLPTTLHQDSGQLVDVARTLAVSTTSATSQISIASSTRAPTVVYRRSVHAGAATEYSPSVHGVPISYQARQRIRDWVSQISSDTVPSVGEISGALTEVSLGSELVSTQISAPSTVQRPFDFKVELMERRLKKIKELKSQKMYKEAVPHLRRAIEQISSSPEFFTTEIKLQTLQLSLAKASFKGNLPLEDVEPLLRSVLDHEGTSTTEKSEAAHYLACLLSENHSSRLEEAKDLCEMAVWTRTDTLGRDNSKTYKSIWTLAEICHKLQDPDEELWRDILPKSFTAPTPRRILPQTLEGHSSCVRAVAFSPDGKLLASASEDETVKLWDAGSGEKLKTLEGHSNYVRAVAFSPDGKLLASVDGTVRLWDVSSGALRKTLKGYSNYVRAVAFSPDGKPEDYLDDVHAVAFSPDGKLLASTDIEGIVRIWDVGSGVARKTLEGYSYYVAFSPDGKLLASAFNDNTVRLWDPASGALRKMLKGHSGYILAVAFSPDGKLLSSVSEDGTFRLWDANSGALWKMLEGRSSYVRAVAFSPDGKLLASVSDDKTVRLWHAGSEALRKTLKCHSPDGKLLPSASDNKTTWPSHACSGDLRKMLKGYSSYIRAVAFSPDGKLLASVSDDNTVKLWDSDSGALRKTLKGHSDYLRAVAFSPDGQLLASASVDKTVRLWDPILLDAHLHCN